MKLSVTGHRPDKLGGWDDRDNPVANAVRARIWGTLDSLRPESVGTGLALGVDTWTAEACLGLGIPFDAYIAFEGQDSRWPMYSRWRYTSLLYKARRLVVVSKTRPANNHEAAAMLQRRNERNVDEHDELLAVFDGSVGGTFNTVRYALETHKPITYLRPPW